MAWPALDCGTASELPEHVSSKRAELIDAVAQDPETTQRAWKRDWLGLLLAVPSLRLQSVRRHVGRPKTTRCKAFVAGDMACRFC